MPKFPPTVQENLRHLQRQIDQINTARPGPMSWGPDDGHIRIYKANGTDVWFEADSAGGARVESRGAVTGLTPLLDSIRDKNDNQDNVLGDHREWLIGHNEQLTDHRGRLDGHDTRLGNAEGRLDGHDSTLSSHNTRIGTAQSTANGAASAASTAQSRADSAYTRAGTGISDAAAAHARANAAYNLAAGAATPGDMGNLIDAINARLGVLRVWFASAKQSNPSLPDAPGLSNIPR